MASSDSITSKICTKCGIDKPLTDYYRSSKNNGYRSICKRCHCEQTKNAVLRNRDAQLARQRDWYQRNKDRHNEKSAAWYAANKGRHKELTARWAAENAEHVKTLSGRWYRENRERVRLLGKANRDKNKAREKERARRYYQENKESLQERNRRWHHENWQKSLSLCRNRRARIKQASGRHSKSDIDRLIKLQSSRCANCRSKLPKRGYHVDHIIPVSKGGSNGRSNLQILCGPCNLRKHAKDPIEFAQEQGRLL